MTPPPAAAPSDLGGLLLPELKQIAAGMGIAGASAMRKGDLVAAISAQQAAAKGNGRAGSNGAKALALSRARKAARTALRQGHSRAMEQLRLRMKELNRGSEQYQKLRAQRDKMREEYRRAVKNGAKAGRAEQDRSSGRATARHPSPAADTR